MRRSDKKHWKPLVFHRCSIVSTTFWTIQCLARISMRSLCSFIRQLEFRSRVHTSFLVSEGRMKDPSAKRSCTKKYRKRATKNATLRSENQKCSKNNLKLQLKEKDNWKWTAKWTYRGQSYPRENEWNSQTNSGGIGTKPQPPHVLLPTADPQPLRERADARLRGEVEVWAVQKHVHLVDLVKSSPTNIYFQKSASIRPRTSPPKYGLSPAAVLLLRTPPTPTHQPTNPGSNEQPCWQ